jgi:heavy metal sensor kinase
MTFPAGPRTIRGRVALWFTATVAVLLLGFGTGGYLFLARTAAATIDAELDDAASAVASALSLEASARQPVGAFVPRVVREMRFRGMVVAVYERESRALVTGEPLPGFEPHLARAPRDRVLHATDEGATPPLRYVARPARVGDQALVIGVARSLGNQRQILARYRLGLAAGIPVVLVLSALGGWTLARKTLAPVARMTERAAQIGASTLHERLPLGNPTDELGRLAGVFNDLLARLDHAFEQQRQFMADASHELRTPVAIIGGEAQLALSRDERSAAELRESLENIRHESRRLARIVEDLFLLARGQAGEQLLVPAELYLEDLATDCARAVRSLAQARAISLQAHNDGSLPFRGDEALLKRLVINLLDNAIKYTAPGGTVTLRAGRAGEHYELRVSDTGPGIAEAMQPRLFDRFYRLRRARVAGEDPGGAGLGLAIARWIAEAHEGTLTLDASSAGGSTFTVRLPIPAPAG